MSESNALPARFYRDPADAIDTLRKIERQLSGCEKCGNVVGRLWGGDVCGLGKKPDIDGFCKWWRGR